MEKEEVVEVLLWMVSGSIYLVDFSDCHRFIFKLRDGFRRFGMLKKVSTFYPSTSFYVTYDLDFNKGGASSVSKLTFLSISLD
jgi:hypothetical protein